jgi:antitoxin component YwqK of YwqJK toxin-antitoxin module
MDGFLEVGNCFNGLRDGEWKRVDSNGKILAIYKYNKGIKNGSFERYYTNGKIKSKEFYKDGLLQGFKFTYSENGKISGKIKFTNGIMDSAYYYNIYYVNSNKTEYFLERICVFDTILFNYESFLVFNKEDPEYGIYKEFYPSGVLKEEGSSIGHNDNYGKVLSYDIGGNKTSETEYPSIEGLLTEGFSLQNKNRNRILGFESALEETFYSSGKLKTSASYKEHIVKHYDGDNKELFHVLDGEIHSYYENGEIQIDGFFKENNLVGKLTYYHLDGTIETFTLNEIYNSKNNVLQNLLHEISGNL